MKKELIHIALSLLCIASAATAQVKSPDGRIGMHDVMTTYSDGKVTVSMQLDATQVDLHRTEAIVLTPVVRAAGNERELTPVVLSGRNRMKSDHRAVRFHRALPYDPTSSVAPAMIPYIASTVYEPWMAGAILALKEDVYGCAQKHVSVGSVALTALRPAEPVKPVGTPAVTYITPVAEAVKNRHMSGSAFLDFPAGKSVILSDFRDNSNELSKIRKMLDGLHGDEAVVIDSISLRGFASPEGGYATNKHLSQQRAEALRSYLQRAYSFPSTMFSVSSAAEDWTGLEALVEASDIAGRDDVLSVIGSGGDPDVRERKLKTLAAYPKLLKDYFPQLRRVEYRLDYTVRAFSVEDGKKKIRTNPGQMSLNEMFLVANTYPRGSDEFKRAFDVAVHIFPADTVANLNEAAMLLEHGDATAARRYLEPYVSHPGAWNNLGVMYLLEGDHAHAKTYFDKAAGSPEAAKNHELLARMEAYEKMKADWDAYSK